MYKHIHIHVCWFILKISNTLIDSPNLTLTVFFNWNGRPKQSAYFIIIKLGFLLCPSFSGFPWTSHLLDTWTVAYNGVTISHDGEKMLLTLADTDHFPPLSKDPKRHKCHQPCEVTKPEDLTWFISRLLIKSIIHQKHINWSQGLPAIAEHLLLF